MAARHRPVWRQTISSGRGSCFQIDEQLVGRRGCGMVVTVEMDVDWVAGELTRHGHVTCDNPLPTGLLAGLEESCRAANAFAPAGIGRGERHQGATIVRRDQTRWLDPDQEIDGAYLRWMDGLRSSLNERLYLGLLDYDCHYAVYAAGGHYDKHLDSLGGARNRLLSTVLYLNRDWALADGGQLVLYRGADVRPIACILPEPGRMVLFLSEDFPHEVLAATRSRHSIAGWFTGRSGPFDSTS